jgi:predicted nucleic acid-binding protein
VILVPDANALIYLSKAGLLEDVLVDGGKRLEVEGVRVGECAHEEAVERGVQAGYTDAHVLKRFVEHECESVETGKRHPVDHLVDRLGGRGEAEALLLARQTEEPTCVVTSDRRAYERIDRTGTQVVRTDTLVYTAHEEGHLPRYDLYEQLLSLRQVNGTTDARLAFFVNQTEEQP